MKNVSGMECFYEKHWEGLLGERKELYNIKNFSESKVVVSVEIWAFSALS